MMPSYSVYGIRLDSDVLLPELTPYSGSEHEPQAVMRVRLQIARLIEFDPDAVFLRHDNIDGQEWLICATTRGGYLLRFPGLADFFVSEGGDEIECCGLCDATSRDMLRHLLLDAVIPRVLDLRGLEAIHATAVAIDGGACAFLGPTGAGKSTLATSLVRSGALLLGDDCVVLCSAREIVLTPGYAGTRLWGDSLDALGIYPARSETIGDDGWKRRVPDLRRNFATESLPLKQIYRLNRLTDNVADQTYAPRIERMSRAESLIELASASYRFNPTDRFANLRQFRFLEQVVAKVPIKKLVVPNDFAALPAVREMVLADMSGHERDSVGFLEVC